MTQVAFIQFFRLKNWKAATTLFVFDLFHKTNLITIPGCHDVLTVQYCCDFSFF